MGVDHSPHQVLEQHRGWGYLGWTLFLGMVICKREMLVGISDNVSMGRLEVWMMKVPMMLGW